MGRKPRARNLAKDTKKVFKDSGKSFMKFIKKLSKQSWNVLNAGMKNQKKLILYLHLTHYKYSMIKKKIF